VAAEKARERDGARTEKVKLIALEQVKKLRLVPKLIVLVGVNGRRLGSVLLLVAVEWPHRIASEIIYVNSKHCFLLTLL
jgi:hypothetical protein